MTDKNARVDLLRRIFPTVAIDIDEKREIHAHLPLGHPYAPEIERFCDLVTRDLSTGQREYLKFRDSPLPPPV